MFIIVSSFLFGYSIGCYSFDLLKPKNPRNEITDSVLSFNKNNGIKCGLLNRKITRNKNQ